MPCWSLIVLGHHDDRGPAPQGVAPTASKRLELPGVLACIPNGCAICPMKFMVNGGDEGSDTIHDILRKFHRYAIEIKVLG